MLELRFQVVGRCLCSLCTEEGTRHLPSCSLHVLIPTCCCWRVCLCCSVFSSLSFREAGGEYLLLDVPEMGGENEPGFRLIPLRKVLKHSWRGSKS